MSKPDSNRAVPGIMARMAEWLAGEGRHPRSGGAQGVDTRTRVADGRRFREAFHRTAYFV